VFSARSQQTPILALDGADRIPPANRSHLNRLKFGLGRAPATSACSCAISATAARCTCDCRSGFASDFADLFRKWRGEVTRGSRAYLPRTWRAASGSAAQVYGPGQDRAHHSSDVLLLRRMRLTTGACLVRTVAETPTKTRRVFVAPTGRARRLKRGGPPADWSGPGFFLPAGCGPPATRCANRGARAPRASTLPTTVFNEIVRRCVSDLYMLITDTPHGHYPYAGHAVVSAPPSAADGLINRSDDPVARSDHLRKEF